VLMFMNGELGLLKRCKKWQIGQMPIKKVNLSTPSNFCMDELPISTTLSWHFYGLMKDATIISTMALLATFSVTTLPLLWRSCFIYCYAECHYVRCPTKWQVDEKTLNQFRFFNAVDSALEQNKGSLNFFGSSALAKQYCGRPIDS